MLSPIAALFRREYLLFFSLRGRWRPGDAVGVDGDTLDSRTGRPIPAGTYVITRVDWSATVAPAFYGRRA